MSSAPAITSKRSAGWRFGVPLIVIIVAAMLAAITTLAGSSPQAGAQNVDTTCYSINEDIGTMVQWQGDTETTVGATGLTAVESLGANQDRNQLWTFNNADSMLYSFTPGSATPSAEASFTGGDVDSLTWVNHTNGDPSDDQLWGTLRNGTNNAPNAADQIVQIDPSTGAILSGPTTVTDPGAGTSDERDDLDGLVWDPTSGIIYSVIGGDTTNNELITIDPGTGAITQLVLTPAITDIESLGMGTDGQVYGTTGEDQSTPQNFYRIDKNSGAVTLVGALTQGTDYEGTACLTATPPINVTPATCYTIDEGSGNAGDNNHLIQVDVASDGTATFTDLGLIPGTINIENLGYRNGFDPEALYAYDPSINSLIRIDETDGTTTSPVFTAAIGDVDGLTWVLDNNASAADDQLWMVLRNAGADDEIVQVDPTDGSIITGPVTILTTRVGAANNNVDGLAWDPVGGLVYGVIGGSAFTNVLITINPADGVVTEVGLTGVIDIEGLGFDDNGQLYGTTGEDGPNADRFLVIDKTTGAATITGDLAPTGYVDFESLDCAGTTALDQPDLQIRLTVVAAGDPCPADFASAVEGVGPALQVAEGDDVTYCLKVINNGPGTASNVVVNHPLLPAPVTLNDLAPGEEDMTMFDDTVTPTTPLVTDATVDGEDDGGNALPQDTDPAQIAVIEQPDLQIRLTVVAAGDPCPADFASAVEGVGPALQVAEGDDVTYCLKVINNGPGTATNVVVNHPLLPAPVTLNDLAPGEEDMTMFDDTVTPTTPLVTDATVDGEDTGGNAVPQDTDPAQIAVAGQPALDIRLTVVPAGDACPGDYASAIEDVGTPLPVDIGDDVTYCVNVINTGPGDAQNVTVEDPLNPGTFLTLSATDLASGEEATASFDVTVDASTPPQVTAEVNGEDTGGNALPPMDDPAAIQIGQLGSISNRVFEDTDGDGVQDPAESGVEGVLVEVLDENGTVVGSDTTDSNGNYLVGGLPAGEYTVRFTQPNGREFTAADQGGDDTTDSDADPATGLTGPINLGPGENNDTVDAGILPVLGSISNFVFYDTNLDGIQDPTESGVAGVVVTVFDSNGDEVGTDTTGPDGEWIVGDLPAGDYTVQFVLPGGLTFTTQDQGGNDALDSDPNPATGTTAVIPLGSGENNVDVDAGVIPPAQPLGSISNLVFDDLNGDGVQDPGEPGVPGVEVELIDSIGAVIATTTTDGNGEYIFGGLPAGDYTVRFIAPAGRALSPANQGGNEALDSDADPADGLTDVISLGAGEDNVDVDAGLLPGESPAIGLAKDLISGPTLNAAGNYELTYSFVITNIGNTPLTNVTLVDDPATVFAPDATAIVDLQPIGDQCSTEVATGDATLAVGESCVATWFVEVAGLVPGKTYNNSATVTGVSPSAVTVSDISDDGTNVDTDGDGNADEAGENDPTPATVPAANTAALGDYVWEDTNSDGVQDPGEPPVPGAQVLLYRANADGSLGALVASQTTGADGGYLFDGLDPDDYIVVVRPPAGYAITAQDAGADDARDSDVSPTTGQTAVISLVSGETNLSIDAGLVISDAPTPIVLTSNPYTCGILSGVVSGGTGPYTIGYAMVSASGSFDLGTFVVSGPGAFSSPTGYLDSLPDGSYQVSITVTDANGLTLERPNLITAVVDLPCPVVTGGGSRPSLPYPGPFDNLVGAGATQPPASDTTDPGSSLAVTGSQVPALATLAIAMMGIGGGLWIGARRERDAY